MDREVTMQGKGDPIPGAAGEPGAPPGEGEPGGGGLGGAMGFDPDAPVSGHLPASEGPSAADAPEHDWTVARSLIFPLFRPVGTAGLPVAEIDLAAMRESATRVQSQPLVDEGTAGIPLVYVIHGQAYDVIVNGEHLLTWGVAPSELQDAAWENLAAWSAEAPWTDEISGERRLLSSDSGDGWDAVRILLPEVRTHLAEELAPAGRVLVGLPDRHLLVAGPLREGDDEFAALFAEFVIETSGEADEPIDRRVFELVDNQIVEFHP